MFDFKNDFLVEKTAMTDRNNIWTQRNKYFNLFVYILYMLDRASIEVNNERFSIY